MNYQEEWKKIFIGLRQLVDAAPPDNADILARNLLLSGHKAFTKCRFSYDQQLSESMYALKKTLAGISAELNRERKADHEAIFERNRIASDLRHVIYQQELHENLLNSETSLRLFLLDKLSEVNKALQHLKWLTNKVDKQHTQQQSEAVKNLFWCNFIQRLQFDTAGSLYLKLADARSDDFTTVVQKYEELITEKIGEPVYIKRITKIKYMPESEGVDMSNRTVQSKISKIYKCSDYGSLIVNILPISFRKYQSNNLSEKTSSYLRKFPSNAKRYPQLPLDTPLDIRVISWTSPLRITASNYIYFCIEEWVALGKSSELATVTKSSLTQSFIKKIKEGEDFSGCKVQRNLRVIEAEYQGTKLHFAEAKIEHLLAINAVRDLDEKDIKMLEKFYSTTIDEPAISRLYLLQIVEGNDILQMTALSSVEHLELITLYLVREAKCAPTALSVFPFQEDDGSLFCIIYPPSGQKYQLRPESIVQFITVANHLKHPLDRMCSWSGCHLRSTLKSRFCEVHLQMDSYLNRSRPPQSTPRTTTIYSELWDYPEIDMQNILQRYPSLRSLVVTANELETTVKSLHK